MANGTHLVSSIPLSLFDYLCGSGVTMTTAQWKTKISFHKKQIHWTFGLYFLSDA